MAKKKQTIFVDGQEVKITQLNQEDYISLTDMAGRKSGRPALVIANWLRNKDTIAFLGVWEKLYNPEFKVLEFEDFYGASGSNSFAISPKDWIEKTRAMGLISKPGRGGGTFAHRDIAFEFGSYISPEFKLLLIRDYQRLKQQEFSRQKLEWDYQRFLTKVNYRLHTDTIKDKIIPKLKTPKDKEWLVYADEADLLNMAVFGQTARQWRDEHPQESKKGNIRDYADIIQLNVLANLESLNSVLIEQGVAKDKRFDLLAKTALSQYNRLSGNQNLEYLDN